MTEVISSVLNVVSGVFSALVGRSRQADRLRAQESRIASNERVQKTRIKARTEVMLAKIRADETKAKLAFCERIAMITALGVVAAIALRRRP